jgi:SAM-dependent methyltransferase
MEGEEIPSASGGDVIAEEGSASGQVPESVGQVAQQNAHAPVQDATPTAKLPANITAPECSQNDAPIQDVSLRTELPATTTEPELSQDATAGSPQTTTKVYRAKQIALLRSTTSLVSADTDQDASSAGAVTSKSQLENATVNPCTATIIDPTELPVQPRDENFEHDEENTPADPGSGTADATAQAHLIMAAAAPPPAQLPGVMTQIAPAMQPDNDSTDEAYAESTTTSFVTSIKSEVSKGVLENERLYPSYGQHDYGMPIDEDELDRMDLQHRKYEMVIGDKHFLAPIGPTPQRILDLGTGTGIWALDVADMYPSAEVIGVDIAPIQPKWTASNCQFEIDDVEETWTFKQNSFDFIHFRDPLYVVRNWPKLMEQCYSHTKPGGWCELACIYPVPMCDDGTMPADSGFKVICDKFIEASYLFGTPADSPLRFASYLRDAGFIDVAEHIFKVPASPWPKNKRLKQIGALEMMNVVAGATAFGLRAFEKVFGWTKDQTELVMVNFRRDVKNRHYHQYCQ